MGRRRLAKLLLGVGIVILVSLFMWFTFFRSRPAALSVESSPAANVFVNGEQVGRTPYEGEFSEEEVTVKLVPESFDKPVVPYEVKVRLTSGVKTIVRREMGETEGDSSGIIASFEKTGAGSAELAVVSEPDMSQVFVDNQFYDVTPVKLPEISEEVHEVRVMSEGYKAGSISVQPVSGYKLTIIADLARDTSAPASGSQQEQLVAEEEKSVSILTTPVGFLRVREEASTESAEVTQVSPDSTYPLLEEREGWFKIKVDDETEGWVSSEYAKLGE